MNGKQRQIKEENNIFLLDYLHLLFEVYSNFKLLCTVYVVWCMEVVRCVVYSKTAKFAH